jgi:hypothetical protein
MQIHRIDLKRPTKKQKELVNNFYQLQLQC